MNTRHKLMDIMRPEHLTFLQRQPELKGLNVGLMEIEWVDRDGPGQVRASCKSDGSYLFSSQRYIELDKEDFPQRIPLPWEIDGYREVLGQELAHAKRAKSFWGRIQMWYENAFIRDYSKRPHEIEDHAIGKAISERWGRGE